MSLSGDTSDDKLALLSFGARSQTWWNSVVGTIPNLVRDNKCQHLCPVLSIAQMHVDDFPFHSHTWDGFLHQHVIDSQVLDYTITVTKLNNNLQ